MSNVKSQEISFHYQQSDFVLSVPEDDQKFSHNLIKLFQRKKGTLFRVNEAGNEAEKGKLIKIKGWRERISYIWNKDEEQKKVKKVIDATLEQFNTFLGSLQDQKIQEAAVKYLFDKNGGDGIGRLGKALFDHQMIKSDNLISQYLLPPNTVRLKLSDTHFKDITSEKFADKELPFPLTVDLGNENRNYNFWMLLKRKKGQIYQVNKEGKLENVKRWWDYIQTKTEKEKAVARVVGSVIRHLNIYLKAQNTKTEIHQLVMKEIFATNGSICRMSRKVFKRSSIREGSALESILDTHFQHLKSKLADALWQWNIASEEQINSAKLVVESVLKEIEYEELLFVQRLGVDLKRIDDGGSGGARYAFDRYGRKIWVIKPADEGPFGVNNPKWYARLKRFLMSPHACLWGNSEPMNEVDSWLWDRKFNIWSVPPTDIRYVASRDFVGKAVKECSVQMYVEGDPKHCKTLGEYVGVSPRMQWLPRSFLRWYCGSSNNLSLFRFLGKREEQAKELNAKLPVHAIARVAVHNFGVEDIDCHFENILVKTFKTSSNNPMVRIARENREDRGATKEEIEHFVNNFFSLNGHQMILQHLFYSESVTIDGEEKKISLIKHDGGASNPHSHPGWWDFRSLRNKHLFEVLPQFEKPFTEEERNLIENKKEIFEKFLLKKGKGNLHDVLKAKVFNNFWEKKDNQQLFKQWIFTPITTKEEREIELDTRLKLIRKIYKARRMNTDEVQEYNKRVALQNYFNYHLNRIRRNLKTRTESFYVLQKYMQTDHQMRDVFKNVRRREDFVQALNPDPNSLVREIVV